MVDNEILIKRYTKKMKRNNMHLRNLNHSLMRFKDSLKTLKKVADEYEAICLKNDGDVE
jgi:hypothetical protein